jgi:hypothetical protein
MECNLLNSLPKYKFDKSAEGLWATQEGPIMDICTPGCYELTWLKIRTVQHLLVGDGENGNEE